MPQKPNTTADGMPVGFLAARSVLAIVFSREAEQAFTSSRNRLPDSEFITRGVGRDSMSALDNRIIFDKLVVLGALVPKWDDEVTRLGREALRASKAGTVNLKLPRHAGEIMLEVQRELVTLDDISLAVRDPLIGGVVAKLQRRMTFLLEDLQDISRQLHGLTK